MIYPHHLDFMEEAKKAFESDLNLVTYRNTAGNLLALRYGMDRNCISIHEIGPEIGFFAEVMEKAEDPLDQAKKLKSQGLELQLLLHWKQNGIKHLYKYKHRIKEINFERGVDKYHFELFYPLGHSLFRDIIDIASHKDMLPEEGAISIDKLIESREQKEDLS